MKRHVFIRRTLVLGFAVCGLAAGGPGAVQQAEAADPPVFALTIKDHRFQPETLALPAGVKVQIHITNQDATTEEFESTELHREKIVPAGQTVSVLLGPLEAGDYKFFGDFHQETAKGVLSVK